MNLDYLSLFLNKTEFPAEARAFLTEAAARLEEKEALAFFLEQGFDVAKTQPLIERAAEKSGLSPYTVWLLVLIEASQTVREDYPRPGAPERLFWDTFSDLRYKALECKVNYGVWGTFVAFWYPIFYQRNIVKLGRLEYETCPYYWDEPYEQNGVSLKKGDPVLNIHIPSSGEPFGREARLASYQKAWEFFPELRQGGRLVCVCNSWLLCPEYQKLLSPSSNILSFYHDFDIVGAVEETEFHDAWRLYGPAANRPAEQWPEDSSMRRALKQYFLAGGKPGEGKGVLVWQP